MKRGAILNENQRPNIYQQFRSFGTHSVSEKFLRRKKLLKVSKLHALTLCSLPVLYCYCFVL